MISQGTAPTNSGEIEKPLAMRGKLVGLRPIWPDDFALMFSWWSDRDEAPLWTSKHRQITTFQQFLAYLDSWLRDSTVLVAVDLEDGTRFGFGRAYNFNQADGYVWIQAYVVPGYRNRIHVAESAALFSTYLFEHFPLRKICVEIFEFNTTIQRIDEKLGFRYEGRLKEHTWYKDRYWDNLFYSLNRENWAEAMRRFGFISAVERELSDVVDRAAQARG